MYTTSIFVHKLLYALNVITHNERCTISNMSIIYRYIHTYLGMYICMCVYIYVHIYIYIYAYAFFFLVLTDSSKVGSHQSACTSKLLNFCSASKTNLRLSETGQAPQAWRAESHEMALRNHT